MARGSEARGTIASAALLAGALMLTACAPLPARHCRPGEREMAGDLLYFGTAKPGGTVSPEEWSLFLRDVVTPRFPEGLTAWPAAGQWKNSNGAIDREASYVLSLVHPDGEPAEASVRAIVTEYKARFRQESVLRVRTDACASF
jgi:hypothetical protein